MINKLLNNKGWNIKSEWLILTFLFSRQQNYDILLNHQSFSEYFFLFYVLSYQYNNKVSTKFDLSGMNSNHTLKNDEKKGTF